MGAALGRIVGWLKVVCLKMTSERTMIGSGRCEEVKSSIFLAFGTKMRKARAPMKACVAKLKVSDWQINVWTLQTCEFVRDIVACYWVYTVVLAAPSEMSQFISWLMCWRISISWKVNSADESGRRLFRSGCVWVYDTDNGAGLHQVQRSKDPGLLEESLSLCLLDVTFITVHLCHVRGRTETGWQDAIWGAMWGEIL